MAGIPIETVPPIDFPTQMGIRIAKFSERVKIVRATGASDFGPVMESVDKLLFEMRLAQEIDGCCFHAAVAFVLPVQSSFQVISDGVLETREMSDDSNTFMVIGRIKNISRGNECIEQDPNDVYLELATRQGSACYPLSCLKKIEVERRRWTA